MEYRRQNFFCTHNKELVKANGKLVKANKTEKITGYYFSRSKITGIFIFGQNKKTTARNHPIKYLAKKKRPFPNSYFVTSEEKWAFSDSFFWAEGGFFSFFAPGFYFSHEERGRKKKQGSEKENKTLPKNRKKENEKEPTFRNEGQKVLYYIVVWKRGFRAELMF